MVNSFFGHPKNFGNFDLVGPPPARTRGGGGNYRRGLLYHFPALDFEKQKNSKKISRRMPPPHGPPIFLSFFSSVLDHRGPFYIFFFYYITVFLFIFSLFLFTFFSIIECRSGSFTTTAIQDRLPYIPFEYKPNLLFFIHRE